MPHVKRLVVPPRLTLTCGQVARMSLREFTRAWEDVTGRRPPRVPAEVPEHLWWDEDPDQDFDGMKSAAGIIFFICRMYAARDKRAARAWPEVLTINMSTGKVQLFIGT